MFKVRDLMIQVQDRSRFQRIDPRYDAPRLPGDFMPNAGCWCTCFTGCSDTCGSCTFCTATCGCSYPSGADIRTPDDLVRVKEQLKGQLAQIEALEAQMEAQLKPQSLAEVDDLEAKLKAALSELQEIRGTLKE